jgi:UDP-3-O-[3-hydroxymyristoyl] glucosamine N-acyltransferase
LKRTLAALAALVSGRVRGDPARMVSRMRALSEAEEGDLSFLTHSRYLPAARESHASAILAAPAAAGSLSQDLILVAEPSRALAQLLETFAPRAEGSPGVHPTAFVAAGAVIDPAAEIGPFSLVGEGSVIGSGTVLVSHVAVGDHCEVGPDCRLYPHVTLYDRSVLGARCILHSGVVVGGDGFGYASSESGHRKLQHLGRAVLEDDVEVGSNSTIDRGLLGDTRIGAGTKIDNLVMVAHNVEVGRDCLLVAQAGIAGSASLGNGVIVAGQSGIIGHVKIGDGVTVATKSAVLGPVEAGQQVAGIPATELSKWRRQQALVRRLAEFRTRILRLERETRGRPSEEE